MPSGQKGDRVTSRQLESQRILKFVATAGSDGDPMTPLVWRRDSVSYEAERNPLLEP
jgi:hypothetical protein